MDHEQINQFDLIDQYVMGKLSAEESDEFEEHFVDCPECIARLQTTKNFLHDLRLVAAEQASQSDRRPPRIAFWHFLRTLFPKPMAWAIGCLLIAAIVVAVFAGGYVRRLQNEVNEAKSLSEQWERRYEEERQSAIASDTKEQAAELQQAEQLRALEAKLKDVEAQQAKMAADFSQQMRPEGNLLTFNLASVRGENPNASEPVNQIKLPRAPARVVFSIPLEDDQRFENYRIKIFDARHRLIWPSGPLIPNQYGSLSIDFNSAFFRPGHYSLIVEGVKKEGGMSVFGNYPFLIIKPR